MQYSVCSVQCSVHSVQYLVCSIQCVVFSVQYSVSSIQCTVWPGARAILSPVPGAMARNSVHSWQVAKMGGGGYRGEKAWALGSGRWS